MGKNRHGRRRGGGALIGRGGAGWGRRVVAVVTVGNAVFPAP
jgi:hypothetical protein